MAKIVYGMNVSLDGYVDHDKFAPDAPLFRHWIEHVRGLTGSIYGSRIYEIMRYFDEDQPDWTAEVREFAEVWRKLPKWVVSRSLQSVGPNATLVPDRVETLVRRLKDEMPGEITVSGPQLAGAVGERGLIDEYRLYYHPVVLGSGVPFFSKARPPLKLIASDRIGGEAIRLTYTPA